MSDFKQQRRRTNHESRDSKRWTFLHMQVLGYTMAVQWNAKSVRKERSAAMLYGQEKQGKIDITHPMHAWS
jgi:hypothetical protein